VCTHLVHPLHSPPRKCTKHLKVPDNRESLGDVLAGKELEEALELGVVLARPHLESVLVEVLLKDRPLGKVLRKVCNGALGKATKRLKVVLEVGTAALEVVAELLGDLEGRHALHRLGHDAALGILLLNQRPTRLNVKRKANLNVLRVHHFLQVVRKKMTVPLNVLLWGSTWVETLIFQTRFTLHQTSFTAKLASRPN
jgi:hypothetical protein